MTVDGFSNSPTRTRDSPRVERFFVPLVRSADRRPAMRLSAHRHPLPIRSPPSSLFSFQTEGNGPVEVPKLPPLPVRGFLRVGRHRAGVCLMGLIFITTGEKLHKYLICAMGMCIGTFGGLFLCEQMNIAEMKPKWSVSLALGLALWIAVMFVESIVFNSLAMAIGGGVTMIGYSIVIQYIPPQPDYYMFITIGVGVVVGYFCSNIVKAAALKVIYSIKGGFLTSARRCPTSSGSCA